MGSTFPVRKGELFEAESMRPFDGRLTTHLCGNREAHLCTEPRVRVAMRRSFPTMPHNVYSIPTHGPDRCRLARSGSQAVTSARTTWYLSAGAGC